MSDLAKSETTESKSRRDEEPVGQDLKKEDPILRRVKDKQKDYKKLAHLWQAVHFVLGGTSVALASVLTQDTSKLPWDIDPHGLAAIVAVATALSTFWRPDARAKKYNAARHHLRRARTIHEHDKHPLASALNEADEMVLQE